jgi:pimeloyl-ACP methyl ester carboxylesterase
VLPACPLDSRPALRAGRQGHAAAAPAGQPGRPHVLVKTHGWSAGWDVARAAHVLLTHRDLRDVVASYRRMGWAADLKRGYVEDHMRWRVRPCPGCIP